VVSILPVAGSGAIISFRRFRFRQDFETFDYTGLDCRESLLPLRIRFLLQFLFDLGQAFSENKQTLLTRLGLVGFVENQILRQTLSVGL